MNYILNTQKRDIFFLISKTYAIYYMKNFLTFFIAYYKHDFINDKQMILYTHLAR